MVWGHIQEPGNLKILLNRRLVTRCWQQKGLGKWGSVSALSQKCGTNPSMSGLGLWGGWGNRECLAVVPVGIETRESHASGLSSLLTSVFSTPSWVPCDRPCVASLTSYPRPPPLPISLVLPSPGQTRGLSWSNKDNLQWLLGCRVRPRQ